MATPQQSATARRNRRRAAALRRQHPQWSTSRIGRELGVSHTTAAHYLGEIRKNRHPPTRRVHLKRRRAATLGRYAEAHRIAAEHPAWTIQRVANAVGLSSRITGRVLSRTMTDWHRFSRAHPKVSLAEAPRGPEGPKRRQEHRVQRARRAHALRRGDPTRTVAEIAALTGETEATTQADLRRPPTAWRRPHGPRRQANQSRAEITRGMLERAERAHQLHRNHPRWTKARIAAALGCDRATVTRYLQHSPAEWQRAVARGTMDRLRGPRKRTQREGREAYLARRAEARRLRKAHPKWTVARIAAQVGRAEGTVARYLREPVRKLHGRKPHRSPNVTERAGAAKAKRRER